MKKNDYIRDFMENKRGEGGNICNYVITLNPSSNPNNTFVSPTIAKILEYLKSNPFMSSAGDKEWIEIIYKAYGTKCDILDELKKMTAWLASNPNRRKKNYKRFITNWLSRKNYER